MRTIALVLGGVVLCATLAPVRAFADPPASPPAPPASTPPPAGATAPSDRIAWTKTVDEAFETGKRDAKPIFIAINSDRVDGGKLEPAGQMLRDRVYLDPAVVAKSRAFACTLVRGDGTSADYAAIRSRFGIDGQIISPQHIFAFPDGSLEERLEYWTPRGDAESVTALIAMMDKALKATELRKGVSLPGAPQAGTPPPSGDPSQPVAPNPERVAWIKKMIEGVMKGSADAATRDVAIGELVKADVKGDCLEALCGAMTELKKDTASVVKILKSVGKPDAVVVTPTVISFLDDRRDEVRSNAAVTLEYVGDGRAIDALTKRLAPEKDDEIANNVARALGRCGAKQPSVRKSLLHAVESANAPKRTAGPLVGLGYFEKDVDLARPIEKMLKKESEWHKRGLMMWVLARSGDTKSGEFMNKEILPPLANNPWVYPFALAVKNVLVKPDDEVSWVTVNGGIDFNLRSLDMGLDQARQDRDQALFKPLAEVVGGPMPFPGGGGRGGGDGGMGN